MDGFTTWGRTIKGVNFTRSFSSSRTGKQKFTSNGSDDSTGCSILAMFVSWPVSQSTVDYTRFSDAFINRSVVPMRVQLTSRACANI
jgi:hypothetical protein